MVDGWQKLTIQYYILLSCLTNILYKGGEIYFEKIINNMTSCSNKLTDKYFPTRTPRQLEPEPGCGGNHRGPTGTTAP